MMAVPLIQLFQQEAVESHYSIIPLFRYSNCGAELSTPLGNEEFVIKLEQLTGRMLRKKKPGPQKGGAKKSDYIHN